MHYGTKQRVTGEKEIAGGDGTAAPLRYHCPLDMGHSCG